MLCIAQAAVSLTTTTTECHVPGLTTSPDSLRHWRCPATHLRLWRSHVRVAAVGLASAGVGVSDEICVCCPRIWTPHTVTPEIHQLSRSEVCGHTGDQWSLPNVVPFFFFLWHARRPRLGLAARAGREDGEGVRHPRPQLVIDARPPPLPHLQRSNVCLSYLGSVRGAAVV